MIKKLDLIFESYIRYRDKRMCKVCGEHTEEVYRFINKFNLGTRFDEINTYLCCPKCQKSDNGNYIKSNPTSLKNLYKKKDTKTGAITINEWIKYYTIELQKIKRRC